MILLSYFFFQLHDLPDFLSGEEQQNTVHVQICYRRASPGKERRFFKKSSRPLPSPLGGKSLKEGNPPITGGGRSSSPPSRARSPLLRHRSASPNLVSRSPESAVATSPLNPSPPGKVFATRSKLEITHNSPKAVGYDHESPLTPLISSSLQELPLIPTKSQKKKVEYSKSTKFKQMPTPMPKLEPLTSAGSMKHLAVHTHIQHLSKASSQPDLYAATIRGGGATLNEGRNGVELGVEPHRSTSTDALSFRYPLPPSPSALGAGGGSTGDLSHLRPLSVGGLGDRNSGSLGNLSRQSYSPNSGNLPQYSNSLGNLNWHQTPPNSGFQGPHSPLGSDAALDRVGTEEQGNAAAAEVAIIDLYVLKQVTDFYHLLKAAWIDVEIVSEQAECGTVDSL